MRPEQFFLVSFPSETFARMMRLRALYRRLGIDASVNRDAPGLLSQVRHSLGGRVVLLDWSRGAVLADMPVSGAMGIARHGGVVLCSSWADQCVYALSGRDGEKAPCLAHPWFNHIHSLEVTDQGTCLLASAGTDLILEMSFAGEVVWAWAGREHGYDRRPDGTRATFDRQADHRQERSATAERAIQITSALPISDETVLATFFHQGQLVAIDRATGATAVVLEGLCRPHGIHRREGGFVLSDTLGHRIVLLDRALRVTGTIPCGRHWLQDTIATGDGTYLALENVHIEQLPEPGLTNRVVEVDGAGRVLRGLDVGAEFRAFTAREVDATAAATLASAWGSSGDLDGWRWY